jgi:hypothetical protein
LLLIKTSTKITTTTTTTTTTRINCYQYYCDSEGVEALIETQNGCFCKCKPNYFGDNCQFKSNFQQKIKKYFKKSNFNSF